MYMIWQSSRVRTLDLLLWYFLSSFVFLVGSQISGRIRGRGVGMFFFVTSRYYQDYRSDYQPGVCVEGGLLSGRLRLVCLFVTRRERTQQCP